MRTLLSCLFFVLALQRAVCDQLYPISEAEDILQEQPDWSSASDIEPLNEKSSDEAFLVSDSPLSDDKTDIEWIKKDIVDRYKFKKEDKKDMWTNTGQPNFKAELGTTEFEKFEETAKRVEKFFLRNNDWDTSKKNPAFRTEDSCTNLLYLTAARYLLVTYVLYMESDVRKDKHVLVPCTKTSDKKIKIPASGVCYPEPYGTATCTSDYDVGLVGKDAGKLTAKFNEYFTTVFNKPSELVFDTNVYAFTLEFAMPFMFVGLQETFVQNVQKNEKTVNYKMQELASAYYKVFKYNDGFFKAMVDGAKGAITAPKSKASLEKWLKAFSDLNGEVKLKDLGESLRKTHNGKYEALVQKMSDNGGYDANNLGTLAEALLYAAEAYHSRGAIRHVVGHIQMKKIEGQKSLESIDIWVSMIENWGETNKEYDHCKGLPLEVCFLKMSKYMWRMFYAMEEISRRHLLDKVTAKADLVDFKEAGVNPEALSGMWLAYKKNGKSAVYDFKPHLDAFLKQFGCKSEAFGKPFTPGCIVKINEKVNAYNIGMAKLVTDSEADQAMDHPQADEQRANPQNEVKVNLNIHLE